jgi:hypothetical protein
MSKYRGMLWHQLSVKKIYITENWRLREGVVSSQNNKKAHCYISSGFKQSHYGPGQAQRVPES